MCDLSCRIVLFNATTHFPTFAGKKVKVELSNLAEVKKAKRFKLSVGSGHSIHLKDTNGTTYEFNAYSKRDDCIEKLSQQCKALGLSPVFS
jgi:ribosome maturation factor RimP